MQFISVHLMHNAVPVRDIICMLYVFVALEGGGWGGGGGVTGSFLWQG